MSMNTSKHATERRVVRRLDCAGQRVDLLVSRVREDSQPFNGAMARRVDALRADEAQIHARLRELREADEANWAAHGRELGRMLDKLEAAAAAMQAELETCDDSPDTR
jgi:hypothetical protein